MAFSLWRAEQGERLSGFVCAGNLDRDETSSSACGDGWGSDEDEAAVALPGPSLVIKGTGSEGSSGKRVGEVSLCEPLFIYRIFTSAAQILPSFVRSSVR
jgi:hypothetical protein